MKSKIDLENKIVELETLAGYLKKDLTWALNSLEVANDLMDDEDDVSEMNEFILDCRAKYQLKD
jgi:hypothetical protein